MTRMLALPMHGEIKLRREGLRTRDAHLLQWIGKFPGIDLTVESRPEPWPRASISRHGGEVIPDEWSLHTRQVFRVPSPRQPRRWWVQSREHFRVDTCAFDVLAVWNVIGGAHLLSGVPHGTRVWFDLLDDWLVHPLFESFRSETEAAYRSLFDRADLVTANSEATLQLAQRFGRSDAVLIPNGVDPERFAAASIRSRVRDAHRPVVIGYGGKIGFRVDMDLVVETCSALSEHRFEFAGPIMDKEARRMLRSIPNARLLGDVRYSKYPDVLREWDIGWVPHRVGEGEVGGDAIKIYEYLAAGLAVVSTPIIGHVRFPTSVTVADRSLMVDTMRTASADVQSGHFIYDASAVEEEMTWRHKATAVMHLLGMNR